MNADGSLPERSALGAPEYPKLTPDQEAFARRQLEDSAFHDPSLTKAVRDLEERNG